MQRLIQCVHGINTMILSVESDVREQFENISRVKEILSKYDWFFDSTSNQYVLESYSGDMLCLTTANYLDGLWFMYQEQYDKIDEMQKEKDEHIERMNKLLGVNK